MSLPLTRSRQFYRYGILALASLFFLLSLPLLPMVSRWRGDERFYTDAVIGMLQSGNYLTPTYSDGTPRFKKPILTYWAVLASYKTLGVSYLSSRLPFLLAGTLFVLLTYRFALILIRRRAEALVAAAIIASNLPVMHLSIRSTPDMLLALFILMSLTGFANLIFRGCRSAGNYGLAYLGIALAITTKGLLGLLPILFVVSFVLLAKPPGIRCRDLIHGPVLLATLPVALFWFLLAYIQYGDVAVSDFWGDQVGERFSGSKWYILSNAGVYLSSFVVQFLPWSAGALLFVYHAWRTKLALFPTRRREILFMLSWLLLLYGIFTFGNIQRTRYFLPAYPHLAILFSMLLMAGFHHHVTRPRLILIFRILCWTIFTIGLALILAGCRIHFNLLIPGVILAALSFFLITRLPRWRPGFLMTGFGILILALASIWDIGVRPIFFVSAAPEMTRQIAALYPGGTPVGMIGIPLNYESQVRVLSGGLISPSNLPAPAAQEDLTKFPILVYSKQAFEQGNPGGTLIGRVNGIGGWRAEDFFSILLVPQKKAAIWATHQQEYYLVKP